VFYLLSVNILLLFCAPRDVKRCLRRSKDMLRAVSFYAPQRLKMCSIVIKKLCRGICTEHKITCSEAYFHVARSTK